MQSNFQVCLSPVSFVAFSLCHFFSLNSLIYFVSLFFVVPFHNFTRFLSVIQFDFVFILMMLCFSVLLCYGKVTIFLQIYCTF